MHQSEVVNVKSIWVFQHFFSTTCFEAFDFGRRMDSGHGFGQGAIDVRVVVGRVQVHVVLVVAFASKHLEGAFLKRPQLAGHLIVGAIKAREIQKVSVLIHLQSNKAKTQSEQKRTIISRTFTTCPRQSPLKQKQHPTDLLYMSEAAVSSARGSGTGELHAALAKLGVKRVVLGNFDGDTLAVTKVGLFEEFTIFRATRHGRSVRLNNNQRIIC
jgi:hypothetical protein